MDGAMIWVLVFAAGFLTSVLDTGAAKAGRVPNAMSAEVDKRRVRRMISVIFLVSDRKVETSETTLFKVDQHFLH